MIRQIFAYGSPILRRVCTAVRPGYHGLHSLLSDMWETMDNADGVGLAAPQIGTGLRVFVADSAKVFSDMTTAERSNYPDSPGIRQAFINARIIAYGDTIVEDMEGCLSIPGLLQPVQRPDSLTIRYADETFAEHTRTFSGMTARMVQHEYDHTDGRLYLDYLSPFRRGRLQKKLDRIAAGHIRAPYPMVFG